MKSKILLGLTLSTVITMNAAYAESNNTSTVSAVVEKASARFTQLAKYLQSNVADINKVFQELNGQGRAKDSAATKEFTELTTSDGGQLTCIKDGKIAVDRDPSMLEQDASSAFVDIKGKNILKDMVSKLEKSEDEKVTAYYSLPTAVKDPNDNSKTLSERRVFVIWGRKAFLGEALDKKTHAKFVCYISQPVQ